MLRIKSQVASASTNVTKNPAMPGDTVDGSISARVTPARAATTSHLHAGPQAGEKVILRRGRRNQRTGQVEIIPWPDPALHLVRNHEEPAVGVDLGGVRQ